MAPSSGDKASRRETEIASRERAGSMIKGKESPLFAAIKATCPKCDGEKAAAVLLPIIMDASRTKVAE
jgi:hypothetical protein